MLSREIDEFITTLESGLENERGPLGQKLIERFEAWRVWAQELEYDLEYARGEAADYFETVKTLEDTVKELQDELDTIPMRYRMEFDG